jgi:hypothetical protein
VCRLERRDAGIGAMRFWPGAVVNNGGVSDRKRLTAVTQVFDLLAP